MTTARKPSTLAKREVKKLTLKKQTLKDLAVAGKGIKGGAITSRYCGSGV